MKINQKFSDAQNAAITALTSAFAASKQAGIPLNAYATGAGIVFPTDEQSKAVDAVGRAAKSAKRAQLELRIADEFPLVVNLLDTTVPGFKLDY